MYKALHGEGSISCISEGTMHPVGTTSDFHLSSDRSADRGDLLVPRTHTRTATYGKCAFSTAGPSTWNTLPVEIRQSKTLTILKSRLKTLLFCFISRILKTADF